MQGTGVEHLATMEQLEWLSVDIFNLENFEFLRGIPNTVTKLSLGPTRSKKPQLDDLCRFQSLKTLYLEGQQQGIEVLSELLTLEDLTLRSITTKGLHFIANLPRLWSLDIKLGGIRDLSSLGGKESIKYLELWQVRGLTDHNAVSSMTGLQYLFLQSLRNVTAIPDLCKLQNLRRIYLENMKGLKDVSTLQSAPALEEFIHVSAQNMKVEDYKHLLEIPTLKRVLVGFGSDRKNQSLEDMMVSRGICRLPDAHSKPFVFQ
jgi:Leucine-rich repeat (LRR) protein